jgi:CBS-domain-containing membrane protein
MSIIPPISTKGHHYLEVIDRFVDICGIVDITI